MAGRTVHLADYKYKDDNCEVQTVNMAIQIGRSYDVNFLYPGDVSTATAAATIRDDTIGNGGNVLADFTQGTIFYDAVTDKTLIPLSLSDTDTETIPPSTEIRGDRLQSPDKYWQWDAYMIFNSKKIILALDGQVQVVGRRTT